MSPNLTEGNDGDIILQGQKILCESIQVGSLPTYHPGNAEVAQKVVASS